MSGSDRRAVVLGAIASALADAPAALLPAPMDAFVDDEPFEAAALALRFRDELAKIGGETRFVANEDALPDAIAAYVVERGLGPASVDFAHADYSLLRAETLIADTGSAIVIERSAERAVAPYLPRTCIIVGRAGDLRPHLTISSMEPFAKPARDRDCGEALIVTGPSRTADVEKKVVLGAHGPRDVVVFVTGIDLTAESP